jgi:predicted phage terminase large subunit-like protein
MLSPADLIKLDRRIVETKGLYGFVKVAWPRVESSAFIDNWHIPLLCEELETLTKSPGEEKKLLVNLPPGFAKSLICSVLWPAYSWIIDPGTRWIYGSFDESLMVNFARLVKELCVSPWYEARWGSLGIDPSSGDTLYYTKAGGWRFSTSIGGKATGRHADFVCIDDPNKPSELTPVMLAKTIDWRRRVLSSRQRHPGKTKWMCVQQRLHEMDLSSDCIEDGFKRFKLPMRATPLDDPSRYTLDPRAPGELFMPQRADEASVQALERTLGVAGAAFQLQQADKVAEGGLFPHLHEYHGAPPEGGEDVTSWDFAFKDSVTSDYVAGGRFRYVGGRLYMLDLQHDKMDFTASLECVEKQIEIYPDLTKHLIEDKANGPAVISVLKKKIDNVVEITPVGSKYSRANAASGYIKDGYVLFPANASWMPKVRKELSGFPNAAHDDIVDMITQIVNYYFVSEDGAMPEWLKAF